MKHNNLLTGRNFLITKKDTGSSRVTWYSHINFLKEKYCSILRVELMDTTSSCGDWGGFILQRHGSSVVAIDYSQENVSEGFEINTGKVFASFPFRQMSESIENIKKLFIYEYYK